MNGRAHNPERDLNGSDFSSEKRYKVLLNRISDGFLCLDKNFCYTFANEKIGEITGKDPKDLVGKNIWEVFPEAINTETYHAFNRALKEQIYVCNVDYYAPLDLWQENRIYPSEEGLSIFITDISDRKRAEIAIQKSEELYRGLFSNLLNGFAYCEVIYNENQQVVDYQYKSVNKAYELITQLDNLSGKKASDILSDPLRSQPFCFELISRVAQGGNPEVIEIYLVHLQKWFSISLYCPQESYFVCLLDDITDKKNAEEKIKRSENNLNLIIENSTESFVLMDTNFIIQAFNTKAKESFLLQFGKEKIQEGSYFLNHTYRLRHELLLSIFDRVLKGETIQFESDFYKREGKTIWILANFIPVKENDEVIGICLATEDITSKKEYELRIKHSEENLKAIFENTTQGFILLDTNGRIKTFNSNAVKFGLAAYGKPFTLDSSIYDYLESSRINLMRELLSKVMAGETISHSRSYVRGDGKTVWLDFDVSPVLIDGKITSICMTASDSSEKKQIEQEREFDSRNMESLINTTSDLMWSVDKNYHLITYNKPFANLTSTVTGREVKKGNTVLIPEFGSEVVANYKKLYDRALSGESFKEINYLNDPHPAYMEFSFYPIYQQDQVIGTACFARNITETKQHEAQLKRNTEEKETLIKELSQNNKDLQQFGYITSHNLRGPIANLLGLTNLLGNYKINDPGLLQILDGVKKASQKFDETIRDLNTILTVKESSSVASESLIFELSLKKALSLCEAMILETKADINYNFHDAPEVTFNKSYLESIFLNFLTNSFKYKHHQCPLKISIHSVKTDEGVLLFFEDNGLGIDLERYGDRVFQLYQRFHSGKEGKGIGLFLIKSQLESLNASIKIESKPGNGTKFILTFPSAVTN